MDIMQSFSPKACVCGKIHACAIDSVIIEKGAIAKLSALCQGYEEILVVADGNTFEAAGEQTLSALSGKTVRQVIFPKTPLLIPNEEAVARVTDELLSAELIVGIGSGVVQDLCKYVSFVKGIPYMVVATAPSMDGYASNGAAMILGGMKVTVAAGLPKAIVCDTAVLKNAPMEMIQAGYGDIIGKYSALCDWRLSNIVNGEYLCDYIYDTTYAMIEKVIDCADGLLARDEQSIAVLTEALITVGIMMSFAGSSRPASGSEHHLSHFFEIVGIIKDEPYFSHGIDVAYSTVVTAALRERLLALDFPSVRRVMPRNEYESRMQEIYRSVADGCIALQDKTGNYATDRMKVYKAKETEIKEVLAQMPTAAKIKELLARIGLDMSAFFRLYGEDKVNEAVLYAKDLKDRYTVLWLAYDLGLTAEGEGKEVWKQAK